MFTGIIEETGRIDTLRTGIPGAMIEISAESTPARLKAGDSIAVNGVCLTVVSANDKMFRCELSAETICRTSFERVREGSIVNLERPLTIGSPLGGHFVLGHVDGVGRLLSARANGTGAEMSFRFPHELERYLVFKGSIAVDGISLTIASLSEDSFSVAVIPHSLQNTNLKNLRAGDPVNLEADLLGKYFERFYQLGLLEGRNSRISVDYLKEQGF